MKKLKGFICTSLLVTVLSSTTVFAATDINVTLNGNVVQFTDAEPYVDNNGRTMMPVAKMGELIGVNIGWDNDTQTVSLKNGNNLVTLKLNDDNITINGVKSKMDTKALSRNGRTYVPVSAIAKAFGVKTGWNKDTSTVSLTSNENNGKETNKEVVKTNYQIPLDIVYTGKYTDKEYIESANRSNLKMAIDEEYLYFVSLTGGRVMRKNLATGEEEQFTDYRDVMYISISDKYIFLRRLPASNVWKYTRVDKETKEELEAQSISHNNHTFEVVDETIYYSGAVNGREFNEYTQNDLNFENEKVVRRDMRYFKKTFSGVKNNIKCTDVTNGNILESGSKDGASPINVFSSTGTLLYDTVLDYDINSAVLLYDNVIYFGAKDGDGLFTYHLSTGKTEKIADGTYKYINLVENYILANGTTGNLVAFNTNTK